MRRLLYFLPVLAFAVLAGYFLLTLTSGRDPDLVPSAMIDKPAPEFALSGFDGQPGLGLAALKGQVAVVNFFASWCAPCREEHSLLMRVEKDDSLPLYGIDYKDKPADAQRFLAQLGDPFRRIGLDYDGRTGINFGVYGVPETYVIDKQGKIRLRFVGPLTEDDVQRKLLPLVRQLEHS